MEKKLFNNKWRLVAMSFAFAVMTVACSVDADEPDANVSYSDYVATVPSFYEGEWTVNRQVVDTARLEVVWSAVRVRLPERYLLELMQPAAGVDKNAPLLLNHQTEIRLYAQGYTEQAQYMSFASATEQLTVSSLDASSFLFIPCSFDAMINGTKQSVTLLCKENAYAVFQTATAQWTLGIPVNALRTTDPATGKSETCELPTTVTIYYNTKRKITG